MVEIVSSSELIAETSFLLSLTRLFSRSFKFKHERIRNWRLLGIVMDLQSEGQIDAAQLRDAIRPLVRKNRSTGSLHPWLTKFVAEFGNDKGEFLSPVRRADLRSAKRDRPAPANTEPGKRTRASNIKYFNLNKSFHKCARQYAKELLKEHGKRLSIKSPPPTTDEIARRLVGAVFKFHMSGYWPMLSQLVQNLASKAVSSGYVATGIDGDNFKALHWVALMFFFNNRMNAPKAWVDRIDTGKKIGKIMLVPDPAELAMTLEFLSKNSGSKILLSKRIRSKTLYQFNSEYDDVVREYLTSTINIRPRWAEEISTALQPGS